MMPQHHVPVGGHGGALLAAPVRQRRAEGGFSHVVVAAGEHRQEAAGDLVFALGASFKPHGPMRNAPLQRLVVARLEVRQSTRSSAPQ